jgi:BTB/POZ domain-containing protein KCTD9
MSVPFISSHLFHRGGQTGAARSPDLDDDNKIQNRKPEFYDTEYGRVSLGSTQDTAGMALDRTSHRPLSIFKAPGHDAAVGPADTTTTASISDSSRFPINPDTTIQIEAGDQTFHCPVSDLTKYSQYFKKAFEQGCPDATLRKLSLKENGSVRCFRLAKDPQIFAHIVDYIRDGIFPLFHSGGSHDFPTYSRVLIYARFFGVQGLVTWLENKTYLKAIQQHYEFAEHITDFQPPSLPHLGTARFANSNQELEFHPQLVTRQEYLCPRGITSHRDNQDGCGEKCRKANKRQGGARFEEVEEWRAAVVRKTVVVKDELCSESR